VYAFGNPLGNPLDLVLIVLKACIAKIADGDAHKAKHTVSMAAISFKLKNLSFQIANIKDHIFNSCG